TYIAISDWLQSRPFSELIPAEQVTPTATQVALYQRLELRMGSSYLMALLQAMFRHSWGFETYALVSALGLTISSLALGFPAAHALRRYSRLQRYFILTISASSLGGLAFAAAFGFLPQLFGVGLGAS